jgi:hypothetical protein
MIKFNDRNIFVGYIKQLLYSFNLPTFKVYDSNKKCYHNHIYLKDHAIMQYDAINKKFTKIKEYAENLNYINYNKNLKLNNLYYDSYTHQYLGNYLRYLRDFKDLDLMSLYNCYDNNVVRYMHNVEYNFSSQDNAYKIVAIPVKFGQEYTIAINSTIPYEMFCGYYDKSYCEDKNIEKLTYKKISYSNFNQPFLFTELKNVLDKLENEIIIKAEDEASKKYITNKPIKEFIEQYNELSSKMNDDIQLTVENKLSEYVKKEEHLKLFIKLPISNKSAVVILEGNYVNNNHRIYVKGDLSNPNFVKTIINYKPETTDVQFNKIPLKNKVDLLEHDGNEIYAFSDRLIEYLTDSVVTPLDDVADNIKRVQRALYNNYNKTYDYKTGKHPAGIKYIGKYYGV